MQDQEVMMLARMTKQGCTTWKPQWFFSNNYDLEQRSFETEITDGKHRVTVCVYEFADGSAAVVCGPEVYKSNVVSLILLPAIKGSVAQAQLTHIQLVAACCPPSDPQLSMQLLRDAHAHQKLIPNVHH